MDDTTDLLKIKIEKAKRELPLETVNAIDAVDWRGAIFGLRSKFGYTFEQLGDLELETELLLCGLIGGEDYPRELENRLKLTKTAVNELVNEMNNMVFQKIQEELIKNTERKKIFQVSVKSERNDNPPELSATPEVGNKTDTEVLNSAGIKIVPARNAFSIADAGGPDLPAQTVKLELTEIPAHASAEKPVENKAEIATKTETPEAVPSTMLAQKLSGSSQIPMVQTEHTLENISSGNKEAVATTTRTSPKIDPYREIPE